jgi:hypothetical protein
MVPFCRCPPPDKFLKKALCSNHFAVWRRVRVMEGQMLDCKVVTGTLVVVSGTFWKTQLVMLVFLNKYYYQSINQQASNLGKGRGKASLALNVTKFFRAARPVYRASRPVWKFYSVAILKFQITFELPWENKNIQNSNNILKNAKW